MVECSMVQPTQRQAISDDRLSFRMPIGQDVRGLKEFRVPKVAHGALLVVGAQDPLTETMLVEALLGDPGNIGSPEIVLDRLRTGKGQPPVLHVHRESELARLIS